MENRRLPWRRVVREKGVICRACSRYREYSFNIFISTDAFNIPVFRLLRDLLNVEVEEGDGLPDTICRLCVNKLVEFHEFKQIYASSETELRKYNEFKWLLEEEVRPWEEFAEEESFVEDGSVGESAAKLKSEVNGIGVVHLVKEEEVEMNTLAVEEMKIEMDSAEDLDSGGTSTSNMDPFRVDRSNNIGGPTEEPEKESHKVGVESQGISQNQVVNNPSCDPVHEENLQLEYSTPNSVFVDFFPERRVKTWKNNVKFYAPSKTFSELSVRAMAVRKHEREKLCHPGGNTSNSTEYVCNYCNTRCSEKNALALHIKRHVDKMMSASVLPKNDFQPRVSKNLLAKAFKCNECGKMFSTRRNINRHLVFHSGVKPFKCNECGKMFTQISDLKRHSVLHTGVKAFKCNECGKMFNQSGNLKSHSVIHSGVKPFKCNECGKMFSRSSHLNEHSVVHTGVKAFKCDVCGRMFARSSHLRSHSRTHSDVKPFKCDVCGKQFNWRACFNAHLLTHANRYPSK